MNCLNSFFFTKKLKKKICSAQWTEIAKTSECTKPFVQQECHLDIEQQLSEKLMDDSNAKVKRMTYRFVSTQCQCSVSQCMFCLSDSCKSGNNSTGLRNETLGSIMHWNCSCKKKKKVKPSTNHLWISFCSPSYSYWHQQFQLQDPQFYVTIPSFPFGVGMHITGSR